MGWGVIAAPGTKAGPCEGSCDHIDCQATRDEAARVCHHCEGQIGYETPYYRTDSGPVHAACEWEEVDRAIAKGADGG